MSIQKIRFLFIIAAIGDGLLGALFIYRPLAPFEWFDVAPPNHVAYVQFPAALLVIFALMFCQIAIKPDRYRGLIVYGILLKIAYSGVVFWHWFTTGIPTMWKPFAIIDALFAVLFLWAYLALCLGKGQREAIKPVTEEITPAVSDAAGPSAPVEEDGAEMVEKLP